MPQPGTYQQLSPSDFPSSHRLHTPLLARHLCARQPLHKESFEDIVSIHGVWSGFLPWYPCRPLPSVTW